MFVKMTVPQTVNSTFYVPQFCLVFIKTLHLIYESFLFDGQEVSFNEKLQALTICILDCVACNHCR